MNICPEEALRYAGCPSPAPQDMRTLFDTCKALLSDTVHPRHIWRTFSLQGTHLQNTGCTLPGADIAALLNGCETCALFAVTLGVYADRLIDRAQAADMARALMLDACCSAAVEGECRAVEAEVAARFPGMHLTRRFSPGYGDLPLSIQPQLLALLDAPRKIGLTLHPRSLLLTPCKSVTGIIGISKQAQADCATGCASCNLRETCCFVRVSTSID